MILHYFSGVKGPGRDLDGLLGYLVWVDWAFERRHSNPYANTISFCCYKQLRMFEYLLSFLFD
jgi:hypothetical protein